MLLYTTGKITPICNMLATFVLMTKEETAGPHNENDIFSGSRSGPVIAPYALFDVTTRLPYAVGQLGNTESNLRLNCVKAAELDTAYPPVVPPFVFGGVRRLADPIRLAAVSTAFGIKAAFDVEEGEFGVDNRFESEETAISKRIADALRDDVVTRPSLFCLEDRVVLVEEAGQC